MVRRYDEGKGCTSASQAEGGASESHHIIFFFLYLILELTVAHH